MGRVQKKNAKGRLDRYYYLAKEKGYRARSSFKILQINEKYGHFLEKSKVVIDLCAAPGSWCQVASQLCPVKSLIIGVDIVPMKPIPNVITFQSDITTEDCRSKLAGYMKTWKADTVMHDGAPNVGLNWVQDAYTQSQLTLQALKLAVEHLNVGGTFVTKVFRSKDYNNLMWVFNQLFEKVEATKPPASRNVSAEIFVVCKNFKAPKKLDPRFLDPKHVFEEVEDKKNNEAKVFNPELKRRSRQGYEEGDYTLFHPMNLMEWVKQEDDIITTLGSISMFEIDAENAEWKILKKMKQTTTEFMECCKDLKVLGKKDFKMLLRWRKHARDELGLLDPKDVKSSESLIEVEELNEDQKIDKELDQVKDRLRLKQKREKRRSNLQKQKEIQRMQMNMLTDMQIGIDAANIGSETLFNLKTAEKTGEMDKLAKGKKTIVFNNDHNHLSHDSDMVLTENAGSRQLIQREDEAENLEEELEDMYSSYKDRKKERDAKMRAKEARGGDDDAWDGIKEGEEVESSDNGEEQEDDDSDESDDDEDSDDDEAINKLIATIERKKKNSLSTKASNFFSDSIFQDVDLNIASNIKGDTKILGSEIKTKMTPLTPATKQSKKKADEKMEVDSETESEEEEGNDDSDEEFEVVPNEYNEDQDMDDYDTDSGDDMLEKARESHKADIDIATAQAMTMAHELALGKKSKKDLINDGFNKYSFRDKEGLPEWFIEEEDQHSKINRPVTKEAALALKEKMKQLNARPIKKVLEAQGRKRMRAMKRLEKLKKKSDGIMDDESKSEADKAAEIQALMGKMTKKQKTKPKVTLVVARGSNKRLAGRPKGVRGKYKMVDGVLKNEMRALRRIEKKHKKK